MFEGFEKIGKKQNKEQVPPPAETQQKKPSAAKPSKKAQSSNSPKPTHYKTLEEAVKAVSTVYVGLHASTRTFLLHPLYVALCGGAGWGSIISARSSFPLPLSFISSWMWWSWGNSWRKVKLCSLSTRVSGWRIWLAIWTANCLHLTRIPRSAAVLMVGVWNLLPIQWIRRLPKGHLNNLRTVVVWCLDECGLSWYHKRASMNL